MNKKTVVIGLAGPTLDGRGLKERWQKWRPTISIGMHDDLVVDRFELLCQDKFMELGEQLVADFKQVSPETELRIHRQYFPKPWDFGAVYAELLDFAKHYHFDPENEDYLIHITTGTHVIQICLFLLVESRIIPARLLQTGCPDKRDIAGTYDIIDLDLSKYDQLAERFTAARKEGHLLLKAGIDTRNSAYNKMIDQITRVCERSKDPILLIGPSGVGKTRLARLIYEWKKKNGQVSGAFVELNCATLRGDAAMSALFGHKKGAYTGAMENRTGMLAAADGGLLFLDEVGELGSDEQAMLLRAIEEKRFYPMGSDTESTSDFQLICGTNRDLKQMIRTGKFRQDLLARINLWTFELLGLKDRPEDIEPNLMYELENVSRKLGKLVRMNKEAKVAFLKDATSSKAQWTSNFRDLSGAATRMAVLSDSGRITKELVDAELKRLHDSWQEDAQADDDLKVVRSVLGDKAEDLDLFDIPQLALVIRTCRKAKTMSEAGRTLFAASFKKRTTTNDSDRLRKYLAGFGVTWKSVTQAKID